MLHVFYRFLHAFCGDARSILGGCSGYILWIDGFLLPLLGLFLLLGLVGLLGFVGFRVGLLIGLLLRLLIAALTLLYGLGAAIGLFIAFGYVGLLFLLVLALLSIAVGLFGLAELALLLLGERVGELDAE